MLILKPPYSSSSRISLMSTISNLTLSLRGIASISFIIFKTFDFSNKTLFKVASISFVVRISSPIIEDKSRPPFKIILSLYLLIEILSKIRSKKNIWYNCADIVLFPRDFLDTIFFSFALVIITLPQHTFLQYLQYLTFWHKQKD